MRRGEKTKAKERVNVCKRSENEKRERAASSWVLKCGERVEAKRGGRERERKRR